MVEVAGGERAGEDDDDVGVDGADGVDGDDDVDDADNGNVVDVDVECKKRWKWL